MKVARNEKRKKLRGFSYYKSIANFEVFFWNLNLSTKRLFWRCALCRSLELRRWLNLELRMDSSFSIAKPRVKSKYVCTLEYLIAGGVRLFY